MFNKLNFSNVDLNKKKVIIIPEGVLTEKGGVTEISVRRDILNRIRSLNAQRVVIIIGESEDKDYPSRVKTVEFMVFSYCKTAVSSHKASDTLIDEVMASLPHNQRKREFFLTIGWKIPGVDHISVEEFV